MKMQKKKKKKHLITYQVTLIVGQKSFKIWDSQGREKENN